MEPLFFINSALLGVGLAMDAFSVSLADGLEYPQMSKRRVLGTAGLFAFFQALMPMIGWVCVHTVVSYFTKLQSAIPYIAFLVLCFIGVSMIREGLKGSGPPMPQGKRRLLMQAVATSIDALSVGFTIADHTPIMALTCASIIALVTLVICTTGLLIGKRFGKLLAGKAEILGGIILIAIGLEILITGIAK